ncbi:MULTISPECIES: Ger(x)C family spore germination protein [unclassified Bacillus (in: firmicutes)]|uniref:Ger(x)C family spore germination protein n=1 Tax=unclassified Bacillus (in: firmicutes) TaxID=185979 RepID=UPI0008EF5520|nr:MULTISPECIES: Ger(x)C family spore germination protein [unclassified Bacillus (in: firmicutes)]SFJ89513.1 spore germination protein [Bacillus sp. 71mf]SFT07290.1 spore germination protein [Bacillus sp. 103mf]
MNLLLKGMSCLFLILLISGCSERQEIEERGFVVGVALDQVTNKGEKSETTTTGRSPLIKGTYQIVLPSSLTEQDSKDGGKHYININATADSVFAQIRIISKKISRSLFFPHIEALILSEDLLKKPFVLEDTLDVFFRDHEMRRNIRIFVSKGRAEDILKQSAKPENLPAKYVSMISNHAQKNAQMLEATRIGDLQQKMSANRSFVLPVLGLTRQGIKMEGAAVFRGKDKKLIGRLNGMETLGLNYIIGKKVGGFFKIQRGNQQMVFEVRSMRRKIRTFLMDPTKPKFVIDVYLAGTLAEVYLRKDNKMMSDKEISKYLASEMEKQLQKTVKVAQKDLKVDVLGLGEYYKRKNYKQWIKVKKNWDQGQNYFSKSNVIVRVHPSIEHTGSVLPIRSE